MFIPFDICGIIADYIYQLVVMEQKRKLNFIIQTNRVEIKNIKVLQRVMVLFYRSRGLFSPYCFFTSTAPELKEIDVVAAEHHLLTKPVLMQYVVDVMNLQLASFSKCGEGFVFTTCGDSTFVVIIVNYGKWDRTYIQIYQVKWPSMVSDLHSKHIYQYVCLERAINLSNDLFYNDTQRQLASDTFDHAETEEILAAVWDSGYYSDNDFDDDLEMLAAP